MFRSRDKGARWEHVQVEEMFPGGSYCRDLLVAPDDPKTMYLAAGAGGGAANRRLRARLKALAEAEGFACRAPPPHLCTDNAAMIAWAGVERLGAGLTDALDFAPRPRWPLEEVRGPARRAPA